MRKYKKRKDGAVLTAEVLGFLSNKPMTVSELVEQIYKNSSKDYVNSTGRIYYLIEQMVKSKLAVPKIIDGELKYGKL